MTVERDIQYAERIAGQMVPVERTKADAIVFERTGWANYGHTGSAQVIPANTRTQLVVNGGTTLDVQKPVDMSRLWDGTISRITGRSGDAIGVRVRLVITPADALASYLQVQFDISGMMPVAPGVDPLIASRNAPLVLGAGVADVLTVTELLFMGATFQANGCAIWLTSDGPITISTPSIHIQVTHRSR